MQIVIPILAIKYYILSPAAIFSEYETPTVRVFPRVKTRPQANYIGNRRPIDDPEKRIFFDFKHD